MLRKLLPLIKEMYEINEIYILEGKVERNGFQTLPLIDTKYFLQLPDHLSNTAIYHIKQLIELSFHCEYTEKKHDNLENMVEKVLKIPEDSLCVIDIIKNSFSFSGKGVKTALFLDEELVSNDGINEQVLYVSQKKLEQNESFETYLKHGEHLGFSTGHVKLIVISEHLLEPFIKWAFEMKLMWVDRLYMGHLFYEEKIRAEEVAKLKDKFVSLVSHDLRAPFSGILSVLNMLQSDKKNPLSLEQKELLNTAIDNGYQLVEMINKLLDISRMNDGGMMLETQAVKTRGMVQEILYEFESLTRQKRINLLNEITDNHTIHVDSDLFSVVVRNLISNAIKFCTMDDTVKLFAPTKTSIAIMDSGSGIPAEILPNLFKREIKTTTPGTQGEKGTGLGLPLCYDIISSHGGTIEVESVEGKGTKFTITLPLSSNE